MDAFSTQSDAGAITPLSITVLAGGIGVERSVSLDSGQAVAAALRRLGHRVRLCDIRPDDLSCLDAPTDLVFIALHGEFGEDGTVQSILDERGLRYTGSDAEASALAFDKDRTKRRFTEVGIPTPTGTTVRPDNLDATVESFPVPAVVKPVASGSSVDTSIVDDRAELSGALRPLVQRLGVALVEVCIEGPELTCGILGDQALPVCEIRTPRRFYDFPAKYQDDRTEYLFDMALPEELIACVQRDSLAAHRALGCTGFSRVDWMVDADGLTPYALEVNTIPGFTDHSLLPKSAARVGWDFDAVCHRIIELALDRARAESGAGSGAR